MVNEKDFNQFSQVNVAAGAMLSDQNHGKSTGILTLVVKSTRRHVSARACTCTYHHNCPPVEACNCTCAQVSMILHFTRRRLSEVARPAASEPAATSRPWLAPPSPPPPSPPPPLLLPSLPPSLPPPPPSRLARFHHILPFLVAQEHALHHQEGRERRRRVRQP